MFCPKCGKQLPDSASFCAGCGNKVQSKPAPQASQAVPVATSSASRRARVAADAIPGSIGTAWIPAMVAVVVTLILALMPWFVPSADASSLSSLTSGAMSLFGMSSSSSAALDESYSVFQFTTLADQLESYGGAAKSVGSLGLSKATATGQALGMAAIGVTIVEVIWFISVILVVIGSILFIKNAGKQTGLLSAALVFMLLTSLVWSGVYMALMNDGVADSAIAPGLCAIMSIISLVLVVMSKRKALA